MTQADPFDRIAEAVRVLSPATDALSEFRFGVESDFSHDELLQGIEQAIEAMWEALDAMIGNDDVIEDIRDVAVAAEDERLRLNWSVDEQERKQIRALVSRTFTPRVVAA